MKEMQEQPRRAWVIKASMKTEWEFHWEDGYFSPEEDEDGEFEWGSECIRSSLCKKFLREDVEVGDIAILYQIDSKEIVGLARFESVVRLAGIEDFALCHHSKALWLARPLRIEELRGTGCDPECFRRGGNGRGVIGSITPAEFSGIIDAIVRFSPRQEARLRKWLSPVE